MKSLLVFLKGYIKETILAPLFKMLEASFELLVPLVVAAIVDTGITNGDKGYIIKMCAILILLGIVGLISSITAQYYAAKAAVGFSKKLRGVLFNKIQSLSFSDIDNLGTSTMITRMTSDVNQVQTGVNMVLRLFLRSPFIVFGAMIMAFTIDAKAALVFALMIPILLIIVFGIMLITIPLYKKVQKSLDGILKVTRENLMGIRVIRAFCKEKQEVEEFDKENESLTINQKFVGRISALMNPLTYVIVNAAIIILIYVGAIRVEEGIITQGAVIALYNYMSQILIELIKLANLIVTVTKSFASAGRIETILIVKKQVFSHSYLSNSNENKQIENNDYHVVFENVSLTYKGASEESLTDISFSVKKGETIGIIGGTGSGKTSLISLIPHFYDCTKGRVLVDKKDVKEYRIDELRKKVGIALQKGVLFRGTIRDNIRWGKKDATDEEIMKAMEIAQALDILKGKSKGLDEEISQGGKNLSGGQIQRLTIARALVGSPEIMIFDDTSSALDYATDAALRNAIKNMENQPTTFIVSQRTSSISHADKIIVMDDGEIVGIGTHNELLENCEIYKEIYEFSVRS